MDAQSAGPARRRPRDDGESRAGEKTALCMRSRNTPSYPKLRRARRGWRCGRSPGARINCASTWPRFGHAIAGDPKYKCDRPTLNDLGGSLLLHARAIRMPHPSGGELKVIAKLTGHFKAAFNTLGFEESDMKDPFAPFEGTR